MKPAEVKQEIRKMRFESIYDRRIKRELTVEDAAELLGISDRLFDVGQENMKKKVLKDWLMKDWKKSPVMRRQLMK